MKENNLIVEKSYRFALRIVKLYSHLVETKKEYKLSGQILSSGTSIGQISKKRLEDPQEEILNLS